MTAIASDLANLIAQASSFSERLSNRLFEFDTTQFNEQKLSNEHLNRWCQVVAQGNWENFQKRLLWDGLDVDTVRLVLSSQPLAENPTHPSWAATLQDIIQISSEWELRTKEWELEIGQSQSPITNPRSPIPIDPEKPVPFEDLLLPAVYVARQKLLSCLGSPVLSPSCLPLELLSEEAYLKLERSLLFTLVNLCEKTLEFEFSRFRPFGYSVLNHLATQIKLPHQNTHYKAFVQKLLQYGLLAFFQKYPVLGRLIATRIDFWVEATVEFLQRLKADLDEIQQLFQSEKLGTGDNRTREKVFPITNSPLGKVIQIKSNLSDPHNRGRCAIALTFKSGIKLVYKPKDLGLEVAYNQFLDWCNQHFSGEWGTETGSQKSEVKSQNSDYHLLFKVLKVLDRQTYGWVEYVEQLPCEDEAAARRFYQRTGKLLCLLYLLGATDCHYENLIASGEHLVLVDTETLMEHKARHIDDSLEVTALDPFNQHFWDSVLRTGLLPRWEFNHENRIAYDISGLGSVDPQPLPWRVPQWKFINTDNMHRVYETITKPIDQNVPMLNGVPLSPNDYLEELVEGFDQMYRFLIAQRRTLLANEFNFSQNLANPLVALQSQLVRFIFRDTQVYSAVLQKTLAPEFLRNGVERSIQLDILARAFLITEDKPNAWSILHSELRAMEQLDIPYFAANSDGVALTVGVEQPLEDYLTKPSYSQVISRLQKLDETDRDRQVAIIRGAFHARVARSHGTEQAESEYGRGSAVSLQATDCSTQSPLTREQLLASACAIAQEIQSHAIREADGSVYWISLGHIPNADRLQLQPLNQSLYDGNCGIALFLAALARINGSSQFRDLALGALVPLRKILQTIDAQAAQRLAKRIGIGGTTGLGSIVYSLVRISHFLKEDALLEEAMRVADAIAPELITTDQKLDVMAGSAGTILALLALYNETTEPAILDKAIACGQHLLKYCTSFEGSPRAWKTFGERPLTGFSHGSAGIAYALLRLYAVTHNSAYLEAALEGIAYERSVFSSSAANWPDFRSCDRQNGQPGFMVSWCHGAPGIGLARLGGLSILETEEIHQDVEVALQTTQKYGLQGLDLLCCGIFGHTELLLVAAQKLARPELREMALQRAACVVARAEQTGAYKLFPNLPNYVFSPSFFQGTAGIGYELLRLAYPEVLPSVLLLE